MKALKLILIFILVAGGLVALCFLVQPSTDQRSLSEVNSADLELYKTRITEDWERAGDWNYNLYRNNANLIAQLRGSFPNEEVNLLSDRNTTLAAGQIREKVFECWERDDCRSTDIEPYLAAVDTILRIDSRAYHDSNLTGIREVGDVYRTALSLATRSFATAPRLVDGERWTSFNSYTGIVNNNVRELRANPVYQRYIQHIDEIENGLATVPQRLAAARNTYYESLARNIIRQYSEIPERERTNADVNKLRGVRDRFNTEYRSVPVLDEFVREFAMTADENESI